MKTGSKQSETITNRALNRALLARQMLLKRESIGPLAALERVIALQAQQARPPFIGLWTRVEKFERESLLELIRKKKIVRVTFVRGTLHIVGTADYLAFRSAIQPMLTAGMQSILKARGAEFDLAAIVAAAEKCFGGGALTFNEVRSTLLAQFADVDERAMGYASRMQLPLVMPPDDSAFGFSPDPKFTTAAAWLGQAVPSKDRTEDLMIRYLSAFGPAYVADAQAWSGLGSLKAVFEKLRPQLRVFREGKRELFDVPDGLLPHEDTPAPVRFLPGFDTAILGHKDRSRIIADEHRPLVSTKNLQVLPVFLVDGFVAGTWEFKKKVILKPFSTLPRKVEKELEQEADQLLKSNLMT